MANDIGDTGGPTKRTGAGDTVWQHSEEEMGGELGFHGAVRLRGGGDMLGDMGLQDVVRGGAAAVLGESGAGTGAEISHQTGGAAENSSLLQQRRAGDGGGDAVVPDGDDGVVPVRVRGNHGYTFRGFGAGEDELQGMDDVCATLVDFLLHCWSIQFVGRRVFVPLGSYGLFRWLCYSSFFWDCRLHYCFLGWFVCPPSLSLVYSFIFYFILFTYFFV